MSNPSCQLGRIQSIDIEISAIEEEGENLKREVDSSRAATAEAEEKLEGLEAALEGLEAEKRDREEKVRVNKEKIDKDETRLGDITNDKQFKALSKEMADAGKANKLLGMELDAIGEKISVLGEEVATGKVSLEEKKSEMGKAEELIGEKERSWVEAIEAKKAQKEEAAAGVSPPLIKKYETIRSRRGGVAVVRVKDETCQGCYMNIPPQLYLQLVKGAEEVHMCPHCHRILYFEKQENPAPTADAS